MDRGSGTTASPWMETDLRELDALRRNETADVCVVGAGVAGVTTAFMLASEGRSVVVLEGRGVAAGETERTTAHLTTALDERWFEIQRLHGAVGARTARHSHATAIDLVETIVHEHRVDCGFERLDGVLFAPPGDRSEVIEREFLAARRAGVAGIELAERAPMRLFDTGPCLRFRGQAQIHPLRYLAGLVAAAKRKGARFHRAHVSEARGGLHAEVRTDAGRRVSCDAVVVATNTPINDMVKIHDKQAPYRTYAVAMRAARGAVERALYWDTEDPYHYVRIDASIGDDDDELLIVGGEDHRTGLADDADARFDRLVAWARARFPARDVTHRWSGQVFEPIDSLALIGRNPLDEPNVYVATGFSGNGMTYGTIAGILLTDLIGGRENPWTRLYDPSRKTPKAAPAWFKENVAGLPGYAKWITPGDVSSEDDLPPGDSAIVRRGARKSAVHRDADGRLHDVSAACTHLGGIVCWNSLEKTWDCPLHGSRFDVDGRVVCGPANFDLAASSPRPAPRRRRAATSAGHKGERTSRGARRARVRR